MASNEPEPDLGYKWRVYFDIHLEKKIKDVSGRENSRERANK